MRFRKKRLDIAALKAMADERFGALPFLADDFIEHAVTLADRAGTEMSIDRGMALEYFATMLSHPAVIGTVERHTATEEQAREMFRHIAKICYSYASHESVDSRHDEDSSFQRLMHSMASAPKAEPVGTLLRRTAGVVSSNATAHGAPNRGAAKYNADTEH